MGNTPLLTVRCPDDLMAAIANQVASTDRTKTEIVVEMLRNSVPSVPILERNKLPESPAIYFVITPDNKLLYIGQSKNLRQRWQSHQRFQQFVEASPNTKVVWFEFDEGDRSTMPNVEDELITLLDTEYNSSQLPSIGNLNSKAVSVRIPQDLLDKLDAIAASKYPSRGSGSPNRSQVMLDAFDFIVNHTDAVYDNVVESVDTDRLSTLEQKIENLESNTVNDSVSKVSELLVSDEQFIKAIASKLPA